MSAEGSGNFGFGFVPTNFGPSASTTASGFFDPSAAASSSPFSAQGPGMSGSGAFSSFGNNTGDEEDYENEPPLLEELDGAPVYVRLHSQRYVVGINFSHIKQKTVAVLNPMKRDLDAEQLEDADLAGPFVFALLLGVTLLLRGRWTFDYIYGFGAVGSLAMYALVNVMGHDDRAEVSMYKTLSVLGYCLLPMVLPALLSLALPLTGIVGGSIVMMSVLWCTASATYLFTSQHMPQQRLLVAYPLLLFYACFALLTIF